ncbi:MAG TPA: DUF5606 domain-containing protein [Bacteroidales bacterium]|nr:DUF5606 domain-containing protein [Bacteroidales bacterium]HOX75983.1 DUF5606 domain-containing protein [Bacteroidales bacterium]HPM87739.1 DUF5606 domain-containing protein [Bacteroidales bacterium]HQM70603.1 DUF5606 domain-containing protein [Bacteroidales bacterium]
MVLKDIMAISGQPGLYRFIAQGKNAIIVEHLETKVRSSAFSSARVSSLEEISVFTTEEDMPLGKVLDKIFEKENGGPAIDYKSDPERLKSWFEEVLPEYNRDKVYVSDIKKIAQWYNMLLKMNLLIKEEVKDEVEAEVKAEAKEEVKDEVKDEKSETTTGEKKVKQKSAPGQENAAKAGKEPKISGKSASGEKKPEKETE